MIRTGVGEDGASIARVMSVEEHAADVAILLNDTEFVEEEIAHEADIFGFVARVTSVYRYRFGAGPTAHGGHGVNLFNFYFDGEAWKIISCIWNNERDGFSLDEFLKKDGADHGERAA